MGSEGYEQIKTLSKGLGWHFENVFFYYGGTNWSKCEMKQSAVNLCFKSVFMQTVQANVRWLALQEKSTKANHCFTLLMFWHQLPELELLTQHKKTLHIT